MTEGGMRPSHFLPRRDPRLIGTQRQGAAHVCLIQQRQLISASAASCYNSVSTYHLSGARHVAHGCSVAPRAGLVATLVPYFLRATRLVVVYDSSYRYKYAGLVKWRNLRKAWASTGVFILVCTATSFTVSARHHG